MGAPGLQPTQPSPKSGPLSPRRREFIPSVLRPFRRTQQSVCVCILEFIKPLFFYNDYIIDIVFTH